MGAISTQIKLHGNANHCGNRGVSRKYRVPVEDPSVR